MRLKAIAIPAALLALALASLFNSEVVELLVNADVDVIVLDGYVAIRKQSRGLCSRR